MTSAEALHYAIERLNTDLSQTPHIFPLTSGQQALLLEVVSVLGDLQDALQDVTEWRERV